MVEEAAQQRIQAEMRAFKEADSAWIQPPQKWLTQASEDPRCLEKTLFFYSNLPQQQKKNPETLY